MEKSRSTLWSRLEAALLVLAVAAVCVGGAPLVEAGQAVILSTTTSTQDSGLLDVLVPMFEKKTGSTVKVISVGTGQALALGAKGEADVCLVHAPDSEKKYVAEGLLTNRRLVMHNDFLIVGPGGGSRQDQGDEERRRGHEAGGRGPGRLRVAGG